MKLHANEDDRYIRKNNYTKQRSRPSRGQLDLMILDWANALPPLPPAFIDPDAVRPLPTPTTALPGTPEKEAVLTERASRRELLHHPDDAGMAPSVRARLLRESFEVLAWDTNEVILIPRVDPGEKFQKSTCKVA